MKYFEGSQKMIINVPVTGPIPFILKKLSQTASCLLREDPHFVIDKRYILW